MRGYQQVMKLVEIQTDIESHTIAKYAMGTWEDGQDRGRLTTNCARSLYLERAMGIEPAIFSLGS